MKTLLGILASVLLLVIGSRGQGCTTWDRSASGSDTLVDYSNTHYHVSGLHYMDAWRSGSCMYRNQEGGTNGQGMGLPCIATVNAYDSPQGEDTGAVDSWTHVGHFAEAGSGTSAAGSVDSPATAGVIVAACPFGVCTGLSISVTASGGITVGVSGGFEVWQATDTYHAFCQAQIAGCPIIIDTAHEGFQLTNARDGVVTDMVIPGHRIRFGWTKPGSHNAFLVLDEHGKISLFNNSPPFESGFDHLAAYDDNHDGVIDRKDSVFTALRLWIDSNHDGVAQPDELFTLPALGVFSISLHYKQQKYFDANGNAFRYKGSLASAAPGEDRTIYDVFLVSDLRKSAEIK